MKICGCVCGRCGEHLSFGPQPISYPTVYLTQEQQKQLQEALKKILTQKPNAVNS